VVRRTPAASGLVFFFCTPMKQRTIVLLAIVLISVSLLAFLWTRRDNLSGAEKVRDFNEKMQIREFNCKLNAGPDNYKHYYFRRARFVYGKNGNWWTACPKGWEPTGCNVSHGPKYMNKQCRRKRSVRTDRCAKREWDPETKGMKCTRYNAVL
jgi:hypothetical protein